MVLSELDVSSWSSTKFGEFTMRNITLKDIHKSFGSNSVLMGASLALSEDSRVAIVGGNGAGKSTLLKILSGELESDSGELYGLENYCAYVAQDFSGKSDETPHDFLQRNSTKMKKALDLLQASGFNLGKTNERMHNVLCAELSGGEQKKLEIVAGLSSGSRFLALDEPENHLDYQTIEWLIGALQDFRGGVVFVSHDQYLINRLTNTIVELDQGITTSYTMTYEDYLAEKERQVEGEARQWMVEKKTIQRLRATVEMMRHRATRNSDTAATYQQTKRRFNELVEGHGSKPSVNYNRPKVTLADVDKKKGKLIANINSLSFAYDGALVLKDVTASLHFGEKVALFGPNGSGKSTLIKILTGSLIPKEGVAKIGENVRWQVMSQDHLSGLDITKTALEVFQTVLSWPETRCRSYLAKYGIRTESVVRPLSELSGGQQARFKLALVFAQEPEFLILDEPTNHVDPSTWEAIVDAIRDYTGTVLAVTHDRLFIDAIAEKLWVINGGRVSVELGNLTDYLEHKE